MLIQYRPIDSN